MQAVRARPVLVFAIRGATPVAVHERRAVMHRRLVAWLPLLLVAALAAGCAARVRHITDLKSNPARYYDRTVSLEGTVTSAWGIPMMPLKVYRIDDGTGEVTVVSRNGRTPTRGARVRVTGKVSEVAVLGGQAVGLHIQENRLNVLHR
jgi:hypothetical protein